MAYDEGLTHRMGVALSGIKGLSDRRMMGGICFLLHNNMLCGADRTKQGVGRFMFRVGKSNEAEALSRPGATIMEMGGRRMGGMVFVDADRCDEAALKGWIALALDFVGALAPK